MSRRLASPEAETMSYWPPPPDVMRLNMSFDEPAYFALTLHPVCFSNGLTQSGCVYPSHAIRVSLPSPFPTVDGTCDPFETPAAGSASATTITANATCVQRVFLNSLLLDRELDVRAPGEPDPPAFHLVDVARGRLEVLLHRRQLASAVERDDEVRRRPEVLRRPDRPGLSLG